MTPTYLLDVDGTLTLPRQPLHPACLAALRERHDWALTSGSDFHLIRAQVFDPLRDAGWRGEARLWAAGGAQEWLVTIEEDGVINARPVGTVSLRGLLGPPLFTRLWETLTALLAEAPLPEFLQPSEELAHARLLDRGAMVNVVPMGRPPALLPDGREIARRSAFAAFDHAQGYRPALLAKIRDACAAISPQLCVRLGGQTGFDITLAGLDKSRAVRRLIEDGAAPVVFIGDSLGADGNDACVLALKRDEPTLPLIVVATSGPRQTAGLLNFGQILDLDGVLAFQPGMVL